MFAHAAKPYTALIKGPYLNYVINHGGGVVVVKMFDRNDKQEIVKMTLMTARGRWFKSFGNSGYVI